MSADAKPKKGTKKNLGTQEEPVGKKDTTVTKTLEENGEQKRKKKDAKDMKKRQHDEKPCEVKPKEKRDIVKLMNECDRSKELVKKKDKGVEEPCCSWHKYVFYALPLAVYLPWLLKTSKCPPKCCPPRYCCPCKACKPVCPPPKLSCPQTATGCKRKCDPQPDLCAEPKC